ncbi:MAG: hypothetical protein IKH19_02250 [Muribaculaceae bacterium]|nr:hypothetical protein [Muribaculaceae bacterium]
MATVNRTKKSAINTSVSILFAVVNSILTFVLNAAFIRLLGLEYAGINSLFSSVLNLLNIADLGISNAILFRLYKKIADGDQEGIDLILTTYKRICFMVAGVICIGGICCIPFLDHLVKEPPSFPEPLWSLFIIVLANSVVAHALNFTNQMITARQEQYIKTIVMYCCKFAMNGLQLLLLFLYKNIYIYLLIALFLTIIRNVCYAIIVKKRYHVSWNSSKHLDKAERISLLKDTGSLAFYKICRTLDVTVDTFLISKFVAIATTAIYGSFNLLISFLEECFGNINDGMMASIGDLNAQGSKKQVSNIFYQSMHLTFLIFGCLTLLLVPLISPFVEWWIGYTLPDICIYVILLNFFMAMFGNHVAVFRNSMGIFKKGWKRPFFTALFNIVFSVWLTIKLGLIGTLLGTTIARVLTLHWYDPWIVCKYGFDEKSVKYYIRFVLYLLILFVSSTILLQVKYHLPEAKGFVDFLWQGMVYSILAIFVTFGMGFLFPEQKPLLHRITKLIKTH